MSFPLQSSCAVCLLEVVADSQPEQTSLSPPPPFSLSLQNTEEHLTFLVTVPTALFLFLSIFILVCIESVFKRMLRLFSLLIWACLVTMGYLFMFSGGRLSPWDQVDILYPVCMFLMGTYTCFYLGKYVINWTFQHKLRPPFTQLDFYL